MSVTREEAKREVENLGVWSAAMNSVKILTAYFDQDPEPDPDAEVWKEIVRMVQKLNSSVGPIYRLVTDDAESWLLATLVDANEGNCKVTYVPVDRLWLSMELLHDRLREMLPPPVPTLDKAIEAYEWLKDNVPGSCDADIPLGELDAFFKAERLRREELL